MNFFRKEKDPEQVFVPRSPEIIDTVYIPRDKLEKQLIRAISGTKNVLLKGQSGCGKSWLYKKVFKDKKIKYLVVDLSDASVEGKSIESAIETAINVHNGKEYVEESYTTTKSTEASAAIAKANLQTEHEYKNVENILEKTFKYLSRLGDKKSVLVLDNLEHISDSEKLLTELNSILMKVDNSDFSKYGVKILVVGTPIGIEKFYRNVKNMDTIGNRIEEIEEVKGLEKKEDIELFINKSFVSQLGVEFNDKVLKKYAKYILDITNGVPQRLHEYCLRLYYAIEDEDGRTDFDVHKKADEEYLRTSMQKYKTVVQKHLNSYETTSQRRNQVIYCLPKVKKSSFTTAEMEEIVRKEFGIDENVNIQVSNTLSQLTEGETPLLSKSDSRWTIQDSQYNIVIKIMLVKRKNRVVER